MGFTPFHLVHDQEALLPIEVELSSLRVLLHSQKKGKEGITQRLLDLERLALSREDAMLHYAKQAEERKKRFNSNLLPKDIKEGSLFCATTTGLIITRVTNLCHTGRDRSR